MYLQLWAKQADGKQAPSDQCKSDPASKKIRLILWPPPKFQASTKYLAQQIPDPEAPPFISDPHAREEGLIILSASPRCCLCLREKSEAKFHDESSNRATKTSVRNRGVAPGHPGRQLGRGGERLHLPRPAAAGAASPPAQIAPGRPTTQRKSPNKSIPEGFLGSN